jgi:hypothetical protein
MPILTSSLAALAVNAAPADARNVLRVICRSPVDPAWQSFERDHDPDTP